MLLTLVIVYLLLTIAIGLYAARRVKNTTDFAIAGPSKLDILQRFQDEVLA